MKFIQSKNKLLINSKCFNITHCNIILLLVSVHVFLMVHFASDDDVNHCLYLKN